MTYFSDFEPSEYLYDDAMLRRDSIRSIENMYMCASYETVPEALLNDMEINYND
jgi:hypothetical protein